MKQIPGADCIYAIDALPLTVCCRKGTQIQIHPDQERQWANSGIDFADLYQSVKEKHNEKYLNMLAPLIGSGGQIAAEPAAASGAAGALEDDPQVEESAEGHGELVSFESADALHQADAIATRCPSEVAGVELVRCNSNKIYLISDKDRTLAKHTVLGGFGSGKSFGLEWTKTENNSECFINLLDCDFEIFRKLCGVG